MADSQAGVRAVDSYSMDNLGWEHVNPEHSLAHMAVVDMPAGLVHRDCSMLVWGILDNLNY